MHNINNIMHLLVYASIVAMRPAVIMTTTAGMTVSSKSATA